MLITRIVHIGQVGPLDECIVKLTTAYLVDSKKQSCIILSFKQLREVI